MISMVQKSVVKILSAIEFDLVWYTYYSINI